MATTLGDAKIVVKLEIPKGPAGQAPGAGQGAPTPGASSPPPGERRRSPGGDGRKGDDDEDKIDGAFVWEKTKGFVGGAVNGGLYGEVAATIASVPGVGLAFRAAEFSRRYGTIATEALHAAAKDLPPGVREAVLAATDGLNSLAKDVAGVLAKVEATLEAPGRTFGQLKEASFGAQALGGLETDGLRDFALDLTDLNRFQILVEQAREQRRLQLLGKTVGELGGDTLVRMFSGSSGR